MKTSVRPGYKQTEVGLIPEDWEVTTLQHLAHVERGKFTARPRNDPKYYGGDIPFIQTGDVTNSGGSIRTYSQALNLDGLKVSKQFPRGTLFLTIAANIGDVGFADFDAACPDSLVAITPSKDICIRWLAYELQSRKASFENLASNNAQMNINLEKLRPYLLPVPTPAEQEAIAEALSDADALIESLVDLIAKKRHLKQGAMQDLLTGNKRLPGFSREWAVKSTGDVADTDPENLGSDTSLNYAFNYIALEDVDRGTMNSYSEQVFRTAPSRARRRLHRNDVLVATVRPNLMSHLLFSGEGDDWVCSTGFTVVRCRQGAAHPCYVFFHLFAGSVTRQIEALLTGSNYPAINSGDVRALKIPFPEYSEQCAIAAILSDMDAEIGALEVKLSKARQLKQAMMQELLTGKIRLV